MYLPEQPQWSAQLGPTLANSYDRGINNPDGNLHHAIYTRLNYVFAFQEKLV
jgi:hypothetical protein